MQPGILLVGNHPPPYGGVPTHVEYLSRHLAESGWRVHVLSFERTSRGSETIHGYRIHRPHLSRKLGLVSPFGRVRAAREFRDFRAASPREFFTTLAIAKQISRIASRHRLGLVSAYHLLPSGLAAAWAAAELGLPLVTTVFGEIYAQPEVHRARHSEVQYVLDRSHRVLSCSRHCAASLDGWRHATQPDVVYYGVDTQRFSPKADGTHLRERLGIERDQLVVLFVGRMVREMGLETVFRTIPMVLDRHSGVRFLIGGAQGSLTAEALGVQARWPASVDVLPDIPNAELPAVYAASDVVLAPSINARACLGLALIEAMATGRPVIGCDVGGTREVVDDQTGILVPAEQPEAVTDAIMRLAESPATRRSMAMRARRTAVERFDYLTTCARMETIFADALAR